VAVTADLFGPSLAGPIGSMIDKTIGGEIGTSLARFGELVV